MTNVHPPSEAVCPSTAATIFVTASAGRFFRLPQVEQQLPQLLPLARLKLAPLRAEPMQGRCSSSDSIGPIGVGPTSAHWVGPVKPYSP